MVGRTKLGQSFCLVPRKSFFKGLSPRRLKDRSDKAGKVNQKRMHGKVAVITGAVRGIDKATAKQMAREGVSVMLCDLLAEELGGKLTEFKNLVPIY